MFKRIRTASLPLFLALALLGIPQITFAQNAQDLLQQGQTAQEAGKYTEAERIFRQAIQLEPNNADAYRKLGNALYFQGNLNEAIANYRKAIELKPDYADAYNHLGIALKDKGNLEEAIAAYRKAIELKPDYAAAYNNLGIALKAQGNLDEAIAAYQKAIKLDPNNARVYYNRGSVYYDLKDYERASADFNKALQLNPTAINAYLGLGAVLEKQGKQQEAIAMYEQLLLIDPKNVTAINLLKELQYPKRKFFCSSNNPQGIPITYVRTAKNQVIPMITWNSPYLSSHGYNSEQLCHSVSEKFQKFSDEGSLDSLTTGQFNNSPVICVLAPSEHRCTPERIILTLKQGSDPSEAGRLMGNLLSGLLNDKIDDRPYIPSEKDEPLVTVLRSIVRIIVAGPPEQNPYPGAGWVIKREKDTAWIVTNRHVISDYKTKQPFTKIEVEFYSEPPKDVFRPRYTATLVEMSDPNDASLDLAILKVTGIPDDIQPLKMRLDRVKRLATVIVIGHPYTRENPWDAVEGKVTSFGDILPIDDANIATGNSGGPVIDEQTREVIGIVFGVRDPLDPAKPEEIASLEGMRGTEGVGVAYHINVVIRKLQEWQILPK